jgi:3-phenylpropionate/trans-cinnamate dioxygenase ferredoxin component
VDVDGRPIALFNIDGEYHAIDDVCTHDGGPLAEGDLLEGGQIRCPRHCARFDIRTGRALSLPAFEPVSTHRVEVRGDDVYVALQD